MSAMTGLVLPLQILLFGALALWLLAALPAAVVTALKEQWLLFHHRLPHPGHGLVRRRGLPRGAGLVVGRTVL
jgi:hypothetical protein